MNQNQKIIIYVASVIAVAMLIYPPFHLVWTEGMIIGKGFSWIWNRPDYNASVNVSQLAIQLFVVTGVGTVLFFAAKDKD